jgi:hypothetical protein
MIHNTDIFIRWYLNKEQRTKNKEQRTKNREQRTKNEPADVCIYSGTNVITTVCGTYCRDL